MRIVTLLPSATELVCGLGLREQLVGVSHECDWPPSVSGLPVLTRSRIPPGLPSADIDRLVTAQLQDDASLYSLDTEGLRALAPDLIVTQALCDVCAVSGNEVARAIGTLPGKPQVVNLEPVCLQDVLDTVGLLAEAAGCAERGRDYTTHLQSRIDTVATRSRALAQSDRPRVALLDWLDPLFDGGHWVPELIELAGGRPCLGGAREPSRRRVRSDLDHARPDVIVIALCGFDIDCSIPDAEAFLASPEWREWPAGSLPRVLLLDGNAYFSRPGPRLVDSMEILAHALHPELHALPPGLPEARLLASGDTAWCVSTSPGSR